MTIRLEVMAHRAQARQDLGTNLLLAPTGTQPGSLILVMMAIGLPRALALHRKASLMYPKQKSVATLDAPLQAVLSRIPCRATGNPRLHRRQAAVLARRARRMVSRESVRRAL